MQYLVMSQQEAWAELPVAGEAAPKLSRERKAAGAIAVRAETLLCSDEHPAAAAASKECLRSGEDCGTYEMMSGPYA